MLEENNEEEEEEPVEDFTDLDAVVDEVQDLEIGVDDDSLDYDDFSAEDIDGEKEAVLMSKQWYKRIEVDMWMTKAHMATMGIRQQDQYRAQSRQYTANMEVKGDITFYAYSPEDLNKPFKERKRPVKVLDYKEIVGYNKGFWDYDDKKSSIYRQAEKSAEDYDPAEYAKLLRRLVIKTFSELKRDKKKKGHAGRWRGTMEESVVLGINAMFGENRGKPRPYFFLNLPGYNYRLALWRTNTIIGDRYVFTVPHPKTGELTTFRIKGRRFTPGKDFKVFNAETGEKVAEIDDRKLNIGGRMTIRFRGEEQFEDLNRSTVFRRTLIMFAIMVKFLRPINRKYRRLYRGLKKKKKYLKALNRAKKTQDTAKVDAVKLKYQDVQRECKMLKAIEVTNSELTLHFNPRRIRT
nr:hypothetical protein DSAG12_01604 [Candidatus Prometheoarchaeum syntrophicum]